jgi:hypothetical protein
VDVGDHQKWQTDVCNWVIGVVEHLFFGRGMMWGLELQGKLGNNIFISLLQRRGALVILASTSVDAMKQDADIMNVTANYVEERGVDPQLFIFDFARSDLSAPTTCRGQRWSKLKMGTSPNRTTKG